MSAASATDRASGLNYQIGGIIGRRINRAISLESGLHLLIRSDKNIFRSNICGIYNEENQCAFLSPSIQQKKYHILEIPFRIRLVKDLSKRLSIYGAGAYSNYIYFATIYDQGAYENISNRVYYAYSFNTNLGSEYQLTQKWSIGLEVNARLSERRQKDEIRFKFGQEAKNYHTQLDNLNFALVMKYSIL